MRGKHLMALGASCALGMASIATAGTAATETNVKDDISALKARIAELEGKQSQDWLNERRAEEVKSLVRDVLSDADTRASLLQEGITAGHNGENFFLSSGDGGFLMEVSGQFQTRYVYNLEGGEGQLNGDDEEAGFELSRVKLGFTGHVADPRLTYAVRLSQQVQEGGTTDVELAAIGYQLRDDMKLTAGRMKGPFLREELVHSGRQLAVERSLFNETFTLGYVEGVQVDWTVTDMIRTSAGLNDGVGSGEQPAGTGFQADNSDFPAITSRTEVLLAGDWSQADDFTAWRGEGMSMVLGGGIHYQKFERGDNAAFGSADDSLITYTADFSYENHGFGMYAAGVGAHLDDASTDAYGILVQSSYNIDDQIEPFARYEWIDPMNAGPEANIITVGSNYYLDGHNAKFTADLMYAINELHAGGVTPTSNTGLLADIPGDDGQWVARAQFQLLF